MLPAGLIAELADSTVALARDLRELLLKRLAIVVHGLYNGRKFRVQVLSISPFVVIENSGQRAAFSRSARSAIRLEVPSDDDRRGTSERNRLLVGHRGDRRAEVRRRTRGAQANFQISVAALPGENDQVIEEEGARLFLDPDAASLLDDRVLDARPVEENKVQFLLTDESGTAD